MSEANVARARRADELLAEYRELSGCDASVALRDLLADLMHWCDTGPAGEAIPFAAELRAAADHYQAEGGQARSATVQDKVDRLQATVLEAEALGKRARTALRELEQRQASARQDALYALAGLRNGIAMCETFLTGERWHQVTSGAAFCDPSSQHGPRLSRALGELAMLNEAVNYARWVVENRQ